MGGASFVDHSNIVKVKHDARRRCTLAIAFAVLSALGLIVMAELWMSTTAPLISLVSNAALIVGLVLAAVRAWLMSDRGGHTERSAATDRLIALGVGAFVMWAMTFSAVLAIGTWFWPILLAYAVLTSGVLFALLVRNWKAPSLGGALAAHRPLGTRTP